MAQYKKSNIKDKIDEAAVHVFANLGFETAKISDIARSAQVSVGNIYTYYKGKEEIFYEVVPQSFLDELRNLIYNKIFSANEVILNSNNDVNAFWLLNETYIEFMIGNREKILILLSGSQGTKYENIKEELIDFLLNTVKEQYKVGYEKVSKQGKSLLIFKILYEKLIDLIVNVLRESKTVDEAKQFLEIVNKYHLFGITSLFK